MNRWKWCVIEMKNKLINFILKKNAKWKPYYTKTTTIKTNVAKISACSVTTVWQCYKFSTRMCMESWVIWGCNLEWEGFWKLALVFFSSRVINMLFLLTSLSKLASREGVENKHNYDEWGSFVLINCQILKTGGKENPQQLVKKITC